MNLTRHTVTAFLTVIVFTLLLGVAYPLVITGISQVAFPSNANGQLITRHGRVIGSKIAGQQFAHVVRPHSGKVERDSEGNPVTVPDPRYFQGRPSATTPPFNAAGTTFSNLGPNNTTTEREIAADVKQYLALNRPYDPALTTAEIPVDAVNSSGSGIDPGISQANAAIQARRVAAVRHVPLSTVMQLVRTATTHRSLGIWGEPWVNVLELNLALDRLRGGNH